MRGFIQLGISILIFTEGFAFSLPKKLSETGLYKNIEQKQISKANYLYVPQYPLWSDGAAKKRWLYIPSGQKIIVGSEENSPWTGSIDHWLFPVGTKIWKEFSFKEGRKLHRIETRYIEKVDEENWEFGTYLWNDTEKEAVLAPEDGIEDYYVIPETKTQYSIPSVTACLRCHRRGGDPVLGVDTLQLSDDRDPLAPHREFLSKDAVLFSTLIRDSVLQHSNPTALKTFLNDKIHASTPVGRAAMGYLHSNCSSCHNPYGTSMHIRMNTKHSSLSKSEEEEDAFRSLVNQKCQIFNLPGTVGTLLLKPRDFEKSAVYFQMAHFGSFHMPPIGVKRLDEEALTVIKTWIQSLN